jgi:hypothetical protein
MKSTARKTSGRLTASGLRMNVYKVLDRVLETGVPAEVERRGKLLRIVSAETVGRLDRLSPHPNFIKGNPEDLIHLDWSHEWRP